MKRLLFYHVRSSGDSHASLTLTSRVPPEPKRLPLYSVARFALNGAPLMLTLPITPPSEVFAFTLILVVHSSSALTLKNEAMSCPDVPIRAHAHQLRHAAASHWLDAGMSVVEVQHMLGHEQLSTTMRYLDVQMQQKSKAMAILESEDDRKKTKKWRKPDGTLVDFLGLGRR